MNPQRQLDAMRRRLRTTSDRWFDAAIDRLARDGVGDRMILAAAAFKEAAEALVKAFDYRGPTQPNDQ